MKRLFVFAGLAAMLAGCGQNEPGTMGGEVGTPRTVATGAPAEAAKGSAVSDSHRSAIRSEHAMSSFDDSGSINVNDPTLPQASTIERNNTQSLTR